MSSKKTIPYLVLASLLLNGCALLDSLKFKRTPDVIVKESKLPANWQAPLPHDGKVEKLGEFWQQFNDALLLELIDSAQQVSPNIAAAKTRIAQARSARINQVAIARPNLDATFSTSRAVQQPETDASGANSGAGAGGAVGGGTGGGFSGGAFVGLLVAGKAFSMPSLIGLIMLMGIATKNSILLVEYAIMARRDHHMSRLEAILDACHKRARPIVMTTIAMTAGMIPIAFALGSGDGSFRSPMAVAVIGGLLTSTVLSLLVIPVAFTIVDDIQQFFGKLFTKPKQALDTQQ